MADDVKRLYGINYRSEDNPINSSYIIVNKPIVTDKKLIFKLSCSENITKYLLCDHLGVEYDIDVNETDNSILYIPAVATVISIAWAIGADVYVEDIDEDYLHSLDNIKRIFAKWFPQFSFSTRIRAQRVVRNKFDYTGNAVLFSGGIGSLTSFLRNRDKHPALINVWGADDPTCEYSDDKQFKLWKDNFLSCNFDNSEMYFIRTNIGNLVNNKLLTDDYVKDYIKDTNWWDIVSHGLTYTGLSAPITTAEKIANLFVASSFVKDCTLPHGSHVFNFADMNWASTKIVYDSYDLSRQEKIRTQLRGNIEFYKCIKVCPLYRNKTYNCSICEKCWRTIIGLIMEDIDPNQCNFNIHNGIFDCARVILENGWMHFGYGQIILWKDIQIHIPDHKINNLYNAAAFFEWLKDFNFQDYEYKESHGKQLFKHFYYIAKYDPLFAFKMAIRHTTSLFNK